MNRIKSEKGITLVALIITVVVLLILASVTIKPIMDEGIIDITKEAKESYETLAEKEAINRSILTAKLVSKNGKVTIQALQKALDAELRSWKSRGYK